VGPGIPADYITKRIVDGLEEGMWHAGRWLDTKPVTQTSSVLDSRPPVITRHDDFDHPALLTKGLQGNQNVYSFGANLHILGGERSKISKQIMDAVDRRGSSIVGQVLKLEFDSCYYFGVD
jgi:hypothetical protein